MAWVALTSMHGGPDQEGDRECTPKVRARGGIGTVYTVEPYVWSANEQLAHVCASADPEHVQAFTSGYGNCRDYKMAVALGGGVEFGIKKYFTLKFESPEALCCAMLNSSVAVSLLP